ncbi:hypothetical protein Syun_018559 [Stephania yunnanensis]|uniref:PHD-type domain-containing protein n=1 Tax=Stephania yunnanensis TaxID=152371 RepID=A0AAP0ISG4_9MAGN
MQRRSTRESSQVKKKMRRSRRIEENQNIALRNDKNDFGCGVCGDGGNLLCCDSCPSTFHPLCLGLNENLIKGDYHCPYCLCQFCGRYAGDAPRICLQCSRIYHDQCAQSKNNIVQRFRTYYFCGRTCRMVFDGIRSFTGAKKEIQRGVSWFILLGIPGDVFRIPIFAVVLHIMEESFLPILDRWTATNMIRNVISSSTSRLKRLDCGGFRTAILEREGEVVSVASIRIHGNLAEMPFIATRQAHRRRGNCRLLFTAIEGALRSFGVEELVIPAVRHHAKNWKLYYNFQYLTGAMKLKLRSISVLKFPGTVRLVKFLTAQEIGESSGTANAEPVKPLEVVLALEAPNAAQVVEAAAVAAEVAVVDGAEPVEAAGAVEVAGAVEAQGNNVSQRPFLIPDLNYLPPDEDEGESGNS